MAQFMDLSLLHPKTSQYNKNALAAAFVYLVFHWENKMGDQELVKFGSRSEKDLVATPLGALFDAFLKTNHSFFTLKMIAPAV